MAENQHKPLLSTEEEQITLDHQPSNSLISSSFVTDENDCPPIDGVRDFIREFIIESRKLGILAGPAVLTSTFQYSLNAVTQVFLGHVGTAELAAYSVENSAINSFASGFILGLGSALQTVCGQAFGAGQVEMLGIYMQRWWIILNGTSLILVFLYIFAAPILKLAGQTTTISNAAGTFAIWMIPELFACAMNYPMVYFLQSQRKMIVMTYTMGAALVLLTFMSWLFMLKLGWGLVGAAICLNAAWVFIDVAEFTYIVRTGCGRAWTGFSLRAFENLWGSIRFSVSCAAMLCLKSWYSMVLILFAGYLKNAEVSIAALSICLNVLSWTVIMVAMGFNSAVSVRISNELGAAHPRTAKLVVVTAVIVSLSIGLIICIILITTRNCYPYLFSDDDQVIALVSKLTPLLAISIVANSLEPVLSGVAVGAGWQELVAYVNLGCYYCLGAPLAAIFGFVLDLGVAGVWGGTIIGTLVQSCVMLFLIYKTNWIKEASIAEERVVKWGRNNGYVTS